MGRVCWFAHASGAGATLTVPRTQPLHRVKPHHLATDCCGNGGRFILPPQDGKLESKPQRRTEFAVGREVNWERERRVMKTNYQPSTGAVSRQAPVTTTRKARTAPRRFSRIALLAGGVAIAMLAFGAGQALATTYYSQ